MLAWLLVHWFELAVLFLLAANTVHLWGIGLAYREPDLPGVEKRLDTILSELRDISRQLPR